MNRKPQSRHVVVGTALLSLWGALTVFTARPLAAQQPAQAKPAAASAPLRTYAQQRDFLAQFTSVLELSDGRGGVVAVCPEWQGRVMTSACDGPDGVGFGWINEKFIRDKKPNKQFNNYGGEDRFWLGPEAGQFGLWFAPGKPQTFAEWKTPEALNAGPFSVLQRKEASYFQLSRELQLKNASGTAFNFSASRDVRLLSSYHFGEFFGAEAAKLVDDKKLKLVGFETRNTLTNKGAPLKRDTGLVSLWILGMFKPGAQTAIVVPYRTGDDKELGPIVNTDYFAAIPPERLRTLPAAVLFRGDGEYRSKLGVSPRRVKPAAGAIDFADGSLTLVHFSLPAEPAKAAYVNNAWKLPQAEPLAGDAFNSYNDGPTEPGKPSLGGFYELESLSPAAELAAGASLTHHHRTFHVRGEPAALAELLKLTLGVDANEVKKFLENK